MALRDLGADFEHYRVVEFDKHAIASYNAIHGTNFPTMDITQISGADLGIVDTDKYCYIMTYSFPCQDLSVAGKQAGMTKGSGTRSGLLWEVERLLNETEYLPQVLLMENVPQVHGKKNMEDFQKWIDFLDKKGYSSFWQDLNAKDFGVAQNRVRTFMVSLLGDYTYEFPKPIELKKRLKDLLEDEVDEKFYLSDKMFNYAFNIIKEAEGIGFSDGVDRSFINPKVAQTIGCRSAAHQRSGTTNYVSDEFDEPLNVADMKKIILGCMQRNQPVKTDGVCTTFTSSMGCGGGYVPMVTEPIRLGNIYGEHCGTGYASNVWDKETISPTLMTMQDGNRQPMVVVNEPKIEVVGNYSPSGHDASRIVDENGIAPTVKENHGTVTAVSDDFRIRKLTPKECWRLMDFTDEDFEKAAQVNSNTQLYKQAGNSIVKNVLVAILGQMIPGKEDVYKKIETR